MTDAADAAGDASSISRFGVYRAAQACRVSVGSVDIDLDAGDYTPADADEAQALTTVAEARGLVTQVTAPATWEQVASTVAPAPLPQYPEPRPTPETAAWSPPPAAPVPPMALGSPDAADPEAHEQEEG